MFLLIFLPLLAFLTYELYWKRRNFPPGPCPFPLFGNLLSLNFPPPGYEAYERWTKQFGDVYTFWIGVTPHIMINSYEKLRETFIKEGDLYVDKLKSPLVDLLRGGEYGIADTNGYMWKVHRKFSMNSFKDFGFGKNLMQEKILLEVQDVFLKFDTSEGQGINISLIFDNAVANVINQLLFGSRFDETRQEEFSKIKEIIDAPQTIFAKFHVFLAMNIPIIRKIIPKRYFEDPIAEFREKAYDFFNKQIELHRSEIDFTADTTDCQDYVESFLREQLKREADGDFDTFSNRQLANMCLDLWFAGLNTTTNTLSWTVAFLLNNPIILDKLHEEMDKNIGSDRLITSDDKQSLPFMNAVINESQRCANLVPLNLPHSTSRDTVINGYRIPKGTGVIAQISTVMNDETVFPDPYTFNPQRFIDEDGKLKKVDEFVPFSVGKRQCLGEGLAKMELFLFLSNFFNRYKVFPSKEGVPSLEKNCVDVGPRCFSGVVKKRYL